MREGRTVAIDSVSESPTRHRRCDAIVLVDVICDTTTLVTAVAQRRQVFPAASAPAALSLRGELCEPLLAADESEAWRPGFELFNSPARLAAREDSRPLVLACATGAILSAHALGWPDVYLACFRNLAATARHLALRHRHVLLLDAPHDGDVRCEDQMVAARIARELIAAGYEPEGLGTHDVVERWARIDPSLVSWGRSAEELRSQRRHEDLEFVLSHIDDLDLVCGYSEGVLGSVLSDAPPRALSIIA